MARAVIGSTSEMVTRRRTTTVDAIDATRRAACSESIVLIEAGAADRSWSVATVASGSNDQSFESARPLQQGGGRVAWRVGMMRRPFRGPLHAVQVTSRFLES